MCLLVILYKVIPDYPVVVGANRDEDPGRGGEAPFRWADGTVAPRDPRSGGTWIGINPHGVFSAVTNRAGLPAEGPQVNSRGTLPLEAMKEKTAFQAHRRAERIPTFVYSPFNWVYADPEHAFLVEHGGPSDLTIRLRPGLHVLSNAHDLNQSNAAAVKSFLEADPARESVDGILARIKKLLGSHEALLSDSHRICKHAGIPETVSANVLAIHDSDRKKYRWLYHEGRPCRNTWKDVSGLLI